MTRVVVVHNRYVSAVPSGENEVVDDEVAQLRSAGVDVVTYLRDSDEIAGLGALGKARLATRPIRSGEDVRALGALLREVRPDVLHLHNPYPLISPWVIRTAARHGVPVVQTVHNYRMSCVAGSFYRDGAPCEDCLGKALPWPGVAHGCYRGSRLQSVPMAAALATHRRTWPLVSRFLPLTAFMTGKLRAAGIPDEQITVRPNAAADPGEPQGQGAGFFFAGRFDKEKGVLLLLDAWRRSGLDSRSTLVIAGDGNYQDQVRREAAALKGVTLTGTVSRDEVGRLMRQAAVVVVPSLGYEGFPRIVVEAFARARPVLVSDLGALPELVDDAVGWRAAPNPAGFAAGLVAAASGDAVAKGAAARQRFLERYTPDHVLAQLLDVYAAVAR